MSKTRLWTGRVLSALPVLLLLTSGINLLFIRSQAVRDSFTKLQYPESHYLTIGILEIACTVLYLIPRTAVLGAILLTAYLGGATASHVRINDPSFIGAVIAGILVWAGLYLREERLSALVPLRRS